MMPLGAVLSKHRLLFFLTLACACANWGRRFMKEGGIPLRDEGCLEFQAHGGVLMLGNRSGDMLVSCSGK